MSKSARIFMKYSDFNSVFLISSLCFILSKSTTFNDVLYFEMHIVRVFAKKSEKPNKVHLNSFFFLHHTFRTSLDENDVGSNTAHRVGIGSAARLVEPN